MSKHPTLLEHFRSFAYQNNIQDFHTALEYFAVFGGTGWQIDTSKSLESLIRNKILSNYEPLHNTMTRYTHNNPIYHLILSIISSGVEHEDDAFKKAKIGKDKGQEAIDYLEQKSLISFDLSTEKPLHKDDDKSDRLILRLPFMRFWFAFISPHYKSISEGDFSEVEEKWQKIKAHFPILLSNLLIRELIKERFTKAFAEDAIVSIGSYYDKHSYIHILAKRKSGKMLAGACKYSKTPANNNMLNTLKTLCNNAELKIENYVLFSKNGFSSELEAMQDETLSLCSSQALSSLLDNLSEKDLLVYKNKKY
jgi:hypothetical protein